MPKLWWPSQFSTTPVPVPFPPLAPMTVTEGPTGPETGAPELFMASAASLPARRSACGMPWAAAHGVQGFRGLDPEVKGSYREQLWEP